MRSCPRKTVALFNRRSTTLGSTTPRRWNTASFGPTGRSGLSAHAREAIGNGDARPVRVIGTCQDITDQKAAEQEIEHSRQFLSAITNNMAEGMIASD